MSSIRVIVFDFDGTLIDSNRLKHAAFFQLFPAEDRYRRVVENVLRKHPEESRFVVLEKMLGLLENSERDRLPDVNVTSLARKYNTIVMEGIKTCAEIRGAADILQRLWKRYVLYLSSTTPESALKEVVAGRGWTKYFEDIFGHPCNKPETLRRIMQRERVPSSAVLVVGDGRSDREAAEETGCFFLDVSDSGLAGIFPLLRVKTT